MNGATAAAGQDPLPSWTETLGFDEAAALLDLAQPGLSLADWEAAAQRALPQASRKSRTRQLRLVRDGLLDHDGAVIRPSAYLGLFRDGSPALRRDLVLGRLFLGNPWVERAVRDLVRPLLTAAEKPLAPRDAGVLPYARWAAFVAAHLPPDAGAATLSKTCTTALGALVSLGVLVRNVPSRGLYAARRARPEPRAFGWLVSHELRRAGRSEAPDAWVVRDSAAAALFTVEPAWAEQCLDAAVAAGLLERSYLAGVPRVRLPGDP